MAVVSEGAIRSDLSSLHEYNVNIDTREIYLHGYYSSGGDIDEPGVDYRMATVFVKNLNLLNCLGNSAILIHQHTIGGGWNDGIAIYDAISLSRSETVIVCYAEASSMSSITIQAADLRVLMPNTEFMVHYGVFGTEGIPSQVKSAFEQSRRVDETMLKMYSKRCINGKFFQDKKMKESDVSEYIDHRIKEHTDWFLNAEEAVYFGFADVILGQKNLEGLDNLRIPIKKKKHHVKRKRS